MIMSKASSISRLFRTVFRRTFTSKALTPKSPSLFSRLKKNSLEISKWALLAYCTVHFGVEARYCSGPSMEPTIHDGDVILIEKLSSRLHFFQRGDIVVCVNPMDPESVQCKRIVAMPGDIIDAPDIHYQPIPPGNVWLHGDNYWDSNDSRSYGPVPMGLLLGRAVFKLNTFEILK